MNRSLTLGLGMLIGTALGAAAVNGLHAQGKAPGAFAILDISEILDAAAVPQIIAKAVPAAKAGAQDILRQLKKLQPSVASHQNASSSSRSTTSTRRRHGTIRQLSKKSTLWMPKRLSIVGTSLTVPCEEEVGISDGVRPATALGLHAPSRAFSSCRLYRPKSQCRNLIRFPCCPS
jgi:hypothetical protein